MSTHYALLHEIPGQAREVVRLHGPDTDRFVQGTITADLEQAHEDKALAAGLLTVKGKLISELLVMRGGPETIDLLVPSDVTDEIATLLDKHIIMDEVEVERRGRASAALLWTDDGEGPAVAKAEGLTVLSVRHPAPGTLVIGSDDDLAAAAQGATRTDADGFDRWRVHTGTPAWGRELQAGRFPPEVGFVYAVSYDKGCYMGQEPLARIHARGQVNWVMVRVEAAKRPSGVVTLTHPQRPEAGRWTTAVDDEGKVVGLAIVRRDYASAGQQLHAAPQDGDGFDVIVTSEPLGDVPGSVTEFAARKTLKLQ